MESPRIDAASVSDGLTMCIVQHTSNEWLICLNRVSRSPGEFLREREEVRPPPIRRVHCTVQSVVFVRVGGRSGAYKVHRLVYVNIIDWRWESLDQWVSRRCGRAEMFRAGIITSIDSTREDERPTSRRDDYEDPTT